jgi:hypothetical protein
MKIQWVTAVSSMVVLLAGCSGRPVNVNSDPSRNYHSDLYECERDARLTVGSGPREVRNMKDQCMKARGWRTEWRDQ